MMRVHRTLSDNKPESTLYAPTSTRPAWLDNVIATIRTSVAADPCQSPNDGRWLRQAVVDAAIDFFRDISDILPGEPFVYSSREGDLVAEFEAERGSMTAIVSPTFVLLFAVVDGVPITRKVTDSRATREKVQELTALLVSEPDGNLETEQ